MRAQYNHCDIRQQSVEGATMASTATGMPVRKVQAATLATAIVEFGIVLLQQFGSIQVPDSVRASLVTVLVLAVGYFTPPSDRDTVIKDG
jgi:hypothetical protein